MRQDRNRGHENKAIPPAGFKFINIRHPGAAQNAGNQFVVRSHVMLRAEWKKRLKSAHPRSLNRPRRLKPQLARSEDPIMRNLTNDPSDHVTDANLNLVCQPSHVAILQEHFNFLSFTTKPGVTTVVTFHSRAVPEHFNSSSTSPLKHFIYAIATKFYGSMTHDKSIQLHSHLPYNTALRGL